MVNGQLMPMDFAYSEELGLAGKNDRLMLKKALQKQGELNHYNNHYKLALNLSACSFNDATIFEYISRLLNFRRITRETLFFKLPKP
ncbi:hypothetical protein METHB2_700017 [Candidatus Methylobacter favarea]|uniref:EAL domain-containing protein n=1 Tax=Candidatus Methylobacter favarea TaxID=2707345 RepID=A0A8S0XL32_9GAMM|nr:hypothetical protein METHB2_700017 [Candidatus Methylobacter favarea]